METIKHCIKLLMHVKISVDISVQLQKISISNIANFVISTANILPIRYIGTPLIGNTLELQIILFYLHVTR